MEPKKWYSMEIKEVEAEFQTSTEKGLETSVIPNILEYYGKNEITSKKQKSILQMVIEQFKDFMIIVLIIAAIISAVISYIEGTNEYIDSIIIITIVIKFIINNKEENYINPERIGFYLFFEIIKKYRI